MNNDDELKCDCCGKPAVGVYASTMGAISFAYCKDCLNKGIEPYWAIVSYVSCGCNSYEEMNNIYKKIVKTNLDYYGKTIEEFNKDIKKCNEDMYESYK